MRWTKTTASEEAKKYRIRVDFKSGSAGAYEFLRKHCWLDEACGHMEKRLLWTNEALRKEAQKYSSREEFKNGSGGAHKSACNRGILDEICIHMSPSFTYWTKDSAKLEARKYRTKKQFAKKSGGAYGAARRNGWLEEICSHMKPMFIWTERLVAEAADKYSYRKDFKRNEPGAYDAACRKGWLDTVCAHMGKQTCDSEENVIYLWKVKELKDVYKIGYTSFSLGMQRINYVERKSALTAENILYVKTRGSAKSLERKLLKFGQKPELGDFNGATDFRLLTNNDLNKIKQIIYNNSSECQNLRII